MKAFARFVLRFRIPILAATGIVTLALGYFIKDTRINPDILSYLPKKDPVAQVNEYISGKFGGTQLAVVVLETEDVFTAGTIGRIASLTSRFQKIRGVQYVTSLANVLDIKKTADGMDVGNLIEPDALPRTPEELSRLKAYVMSREFYRGRIVSADGRATIVVCRLQESGDKPKIAREIRGIVAGMELPERVSLAGIPFQITEISAIVLRDLLFLIPIAAVLISLTLFLSFRSLRGVVVPLLSVGISTIWTLGIMSLCRISFSVVSNVIPVVLLSAGSAYSIHVLSAFNEEVTSEADKIGKSRSALGTMILPVFLAATTTVAGFLSFLFGSYLTMISDFGIFTAVGILLALVVSLTFVPALLSLLPIHAWTLGRARRDADAGGKMPIAHAVASLIVRRGWIILLAAAGILVVFLFGLPKVSREVDILSYFKPGTEIRTAEETMKAKFGGSATLQILVKGDMKDPAVLREMKGMEDFLKRNPELHNVRSVVELIEEMNDAMADRKEIPESPERTANLWFLLEGQEMLAQLVDADQKEGVIQATIGSVNSRVNTGIVRSVDGYIKEHASPLVSFQQSGTASIYQRVDSGIARSQLWSLAVAILLMLACNMALVRSVPGGLIGITPIVVTLFVLFGFMGFAGIPVDVATVLIGSISLGMGIDYSIHFLTRYRRELAADGDVARSLTATLHSAGKAIFINVATVSVGFIALLFGNLIPLRRFGILIILTMLTSGLGSITILPALLMIQPREIGRSIRARLHPIAVRIRGKKE